MHSVAYVVGSVPAPTLSVIGVTPSANLHADAVEGYPGQ